MPPGAAPVGAARLRDQCRDRGSCPRGTRVVAELSRRVPGRLPLRERTRVPGALPCRARIGLAGAVLRRAPPECRARWHEHSATTPHAPEATPGGGGARAPPLRA